MKRRLLAGVGGRVGDAALGRHLAASSQAVHVLVTQARLLVATGTILRILAIPLQRPFSTSHRRARQSISPAARIANRMPQAEEAFTLNGEYTARLQEAVSKFNVDAVRSLIDQETDKSVAAGSKSQLILIAEQLAHQVLLAAEATPASVDELAKFFSAASSASSKATMQEKHTHYGDADPNNESPLKSAGKTFARYSQRPMTGRQAIFTEVLGRLIGYRLTTFIGIVESNDPEEYSDKERRVKSYKGAYAPALLLARLFATQQDLRPVLWREVQDALIRSGLSVPEKEAGTFLTLAVLADGAGSSIQHWTTHELKGVGKGWLSYMGDLEHPLDRWTFKDVMVHVQSDEHTTMAKWMEEALSEDIKKLRKETATVAEQWSKGSSEPSELSSKALHEKYGWVTTQ